MMDVAAAETLALSHLSEHYDVKPDSVSRIKTAEDTFGFRVFVHYSSEGGTPYFFDEKRQFMREVQISKHPAMVIKVY